MSYMFLQVEKIVDSQSIFHNHSLWCPTWLYMPLFSVLSQQHLRLRQNYKAGQFLPAIV